MAMQTKGGVAKKGVRPFGAKKIMSKDDKARVDKDARKKAKRNRGK